MSATNPTRPAASQPLTDAELRSTLFFAVGVTSENGDRAFPKVLFADIRRFGSPGRTQWFVPQEWA